MQTTPCHWCGEDCQAPDGPVEQMLIWCGKCMQNVNKCTNCGRPSSHSVLFQGNETFACCFCHVLVDNQPPADWHPACLRAYALKTNTPIQKAVPWPSQNTTDSAG